MEAVQRLLLCDPRPAGRGGRFHHRAGNQPDVRRDDRRGAGRLLGPRRARRPTPSMPNWVRAAERWPRMRCGCCARRDLRARCIWSRPARCFARRRQAPCRTRIGMIPSTTSRSAAAAGRQRVPRRAAGPPARRRARSAGCRLRRRAGVRPRWRDRRDFAGAERQPWRPSATHRRERGGVALIIDYGHERSATATRCRRCAVIALRRSSTEPGEQDLTAHVDFEAVAKSARAAARR